MSECNRRYTRKFHYPMTKEEEYEMDSTYITQYCNLIAHSDEYKHMTFEGEAQDLRPEAVVELNSLKQRLIALRKKREKRRKKKEELRGGMTSGPPTESRSTSCQWLCS